MGAQIPQPDALRKGTLGQCARRIRYQDLAAIARASDARCAVHVEADVVGSTKPAVAGVEPHPDTQRAAGRPSMGREAPLRICGGRDRAIGAGEDREKGVAFRVDLDPIALRDRLANDLAVIRQDRVVSVTERLEELRGALDVGKEERDRSGGEVWRDPGYGHGPRAPERLATDR